MVSLGKKKEILGELIERELAIMDIPEDNSNPIELKNKTLDELSRILELKEGTEIVLENGMACYTRKKRNGKCFWYVIIDGEAADIRMRDGPGHIRGGELDFSRVIDSDTYKPWIVQEVKGGPDKYDEYYED